MDWNHWYWRYAEKWNGRGAMLGCIGIAIYLLNKKQLL